MHSRGGRCGLVFPVCPVALQMCPFCLLKDVFVRSLFLKRSHSLLLPDFAHLLLPDGRSPCQQLSGAVLRAKCHLTFVTLWSNTFVHTCVTSAGRRSIIKADKFMFVTTATMITVCCGNDSSLITMVTDSKSSPTDQPAWEEQHPVFSLVLTVALSHNVIFI